MYIGNADERLAREIHKSIELQLNSIGILSRVFSRVKTVLSLENKNNKNPGKYTESGKKIQDFIGIRVVLYFPDDSIAAQSAIRKMFVYESSSIDLHKNNQFSAKRCNLIFELPESLSKESELIKKYKFIDSTFEVQFRTMLSEGWHEIDHDLRYKCQEDWETHDDLSRTLNGIYASLETSDWSMLKLFDELAYRHYKAAEWTQMIRTKFRLRTEGRLSKEIEEILNNESTIAKNIYRIEREDLIKKIISLRQKPPININNILFLCNFFFIKNDLILEKTPEPIKFLFSDTIDGCIKDKGDVAI